MSSRLQRERGIAALLIAGRTVSFFGDGIHFIVVNWLFMQLLDRRYRSVWYKH